MPPGREIHQEPGYDMLPLEDKKFLALALIIGRENGFTIRRDNHTDSHIIDCCQPLILPKGTRIEPLTIQQMEDELRAPKKPSMREK